MLITNALILTFDEQSRVLEDGAVLIENDTIREVGPSAEMMARHQMRDHVDAHGMVLMPGLINAHMHLYSTFARGMALPGPAPKDFDEILQHLWWRLDKALRLEDLRVSALVPFIGGLRAGTTTVIDHHASPHAIAGSLNTLAAAAREAGVRFATCYEVSDRDGAEIARQGIEENAAFLREVKRAADPMLSGLFGVHAQFTVGDQTLNACVERAREVGAGVHVHCSEAFSDLARARQEYGLSAVERLHRAGATGPGSIFAHCIHLGADDPRILGESGTFVSHQASSNMNNAVGAMDLVTLRDAGVNLALGTDGMSNNMWDELRTACLLQKHDTADPRVGFMEVFGILFDGNRRLAERVFGVRLGRIAPDHVADLILVDYQPPTPLNASNVAGHAYFGLAGAPVDSTMINGRWRLRNRQLLDLDERHIAAEAREKSASLWRRF